MGLRAETSGAGPASQPLPSSGTWAADCFSELVSSLVECEQYTHHRVTEGKVTHMKGPSMVSGLIGLWCLFSPEAPHSGASWALVH